jgi:hypothetical protein
MPSKSLGRFATILEAASRTVCRPLATPNSSLHIVSSIRDIMSGRSLPSAFEYCSGRLESGHSRYRISGLVLKRVYISERRMTKGESERLAEEK